MNYYLIARRTLWHIMPTINTNRDGIEDEMKPISALS